MTIPVSKPNKANQPRTSKPTTNKKLFLSLILPGLSVLILVLVLATFFNWFQKAQNNSNDFGNGLYSEFSSQKKAVPAPASEIKDLPLIAFTNKGNVYLYNPGQGLIWQITDNGKTSLIEWSKNGQWLYWLETEEDQDSEKFVFFRAQTPAFEEEVIWQQETNNPDLIFDFFPRQKTDELLVSRQSGIYIYGDFTYQKPETEKRLLKTKTTVEGFSALEVDNYSIFSLDQPEELAIVNHGGWEQIIDTGILNLNKGRYQPLTSVPAHQAYGGVSMAVLSPNDQLLLTSGQASFETEDTNEALIHTTIPPKLAYNLDKILGQELGHATFLTDNLALAAINYGTLAESPIGCSLSIVDFSKGRELTRLERTCENDEIIEGIFEAPSVLFQSAQNFVAYKLSSEGETKLGYLIFSLDSYEIIEEKTYLDNQLEAIDFKAQPTFFTY